MTLAAAVYCILQFTAASCTQFAVVDGELLRGEAAEECKALGGTLAQVDMDNLTSAKWALIDAKVEAVWIGAFEGQRHGGDLVLRPDGSVKAREQSSGRKCGALCQMPAVDAEKAPERGQKIKQRNSLNAKAIRDLFATALETVSGLFEGLLE
jgi:hypothetical protein